MLSIALIGLGVLVWAGCDTGGRTLSAGDNPSLLDIINTHNQTTGTFQNALNSTDRAQMLDDTTRTFMVFVPSKTAFESHDSGYITGNSDRLQSIVDYHIVEGTAVMAGNLEGGDAFTTMQGNKIQILSGGTVEGSEVVIDAKGVNGVVHILDNVLLKPLTFEERLKATPILRPKLSSAMGLLKDTGALDVLNNPDSTYTLFLPSNKALEAYDFGGNTDLLTSVLNYHVVTDTVLNSDDLPGGATYKTVQGDQVQLFSGTVNTTSVDTTDVQYTAGVIHTLDDVLLSNRTIPERLKVTIASQTFFETLSDAGLESEFANAGSWTVFAPTNDALENADLSGFSDEEIQQILNYHVLSAIAASSSAIETELDRSGEFSLPTRQGEEVTISREAGDIVFNNGQATLSTEGLDQNASSSFIHRINGVLIPPSLQE